MIIEYFPDRMHAPIKRLVLDAQVAGKRASVRFTEGGNTVTDEVWAAIAARPDVAVWIGRGALVAAGEVAIATPTSTNPPTQSKPTPINPKPPKAAQTREERRAALEEMDGHKLRMIGLRYQIQKPDGGWKDAISAFLDAEFGSAS